MPADDLLARCTFAEPGTPVVCALSGGPDSSALVALAVRAGLDVTAIHVHHGLRSSADDDAAAAQRIAAHLGVSFDRVHVDLDDGANLEARARQARRDALGPDALTGHTADDQAETVLLALLRGAGATGLAAMRPGPTHPILGLRRAETHALCDALGLHPAVDPTNADARFRRNRVRAALLPLAEAIAFSKANITEGLLMLPHSPSTSRVSSSRKGNTPSRASITSRPPEWASTRSGSA